MYCLKQLNTGSTLVCGNHLNVFSLSLTIKFYSDLEQLFVTNYVQTIRYPLFDDDALNPILTQLTLYK